jgi:hypothetical protein
MGALFQDRLADYPSVVTQDSVSDSDTDSVPTVVRTEQCSVVQAVTTKKSAIFSTSQYEVISEVNELVKK